MEELSDDDIRVPIRIEMELWPVGSRGVLPEFPNLSANKLNKSIKKMSKKGYISVNDVSSDLKYWETDDKGSDFLHKNKDRIKHLWDEFWEGDAKTYIK